MVFLSKRNNFCAFFFASLDYETLTQRGPFLKEKQNHIKMGNKHFKMAETLKGKKGNISKRQSSHEEKGSKYLKKTRTEHRKMEYYTKTGIPHRKREVKIFTKQETHKKGN